MKAEIESRARPKSSRMGLVAYVRILHAITQNPATHAQVAEDFSRGQQRMRQLLKRMVHMGLAHVSGWVENGKRRGLMLPVYAGGPGVSVPYPAPTTRDLEGKALRRSDVRTELMGLVVILEVLAEPVTRQEIQDETGISHSNLRPLLEAMRELRMVHVAHYERDPRNDTGRWAQAFKLGFDVDAKKPKALSRKEICRISAARKREKFNAAARVVSAWAANDSAQRDVA